jgi:catechol 2,3-dioxygenase-like lactoylglutathione lyase family enzyme
MPKIESINAVTLATHDMARAVAFYEKLGFHLEHGGPESEFTTFRLGVSALNLILAEREKRWAWWGRVIFYVDDVDGFHGALVAKGIATDFPPRDAPWGERYFHVTGPDGHELSFARPL